MNTTESSLNISIVVWLRLIWQLRRRGGGTRESGAFLLGRAGGPIVSFICYDDLDPHCLDTGIIRFDGRGFVPLWKHCAQHKVKVLADVHTHPSEWTGQSDADRDHPMIAQVGHRAIILPNYARRSWFGPKGAGFYMFTGGANWKILPNSSIKLTLF